ncbi:MAG: N-acetylmuramoyl-L-alanine amidase [Armatimonadetes bacterium]|nr:N-acetylmuramoyl-L-alanine amidase [Armatimonadota bacterium]MDE2205077.1 N-acetylmuramoyl-L-alanine amidase [Armatimonadota bacterium]
MSPPSRRRAGTLRFLAARIRKRPQAPIRIGILGLIVAAIVLLMFKGHRHRNLMSKAPIALPYIYIPSPNYDNRPANTVINCVVLHATVLTSLNETVAAFEDPDRKVSAHFVVDKDGTVVQMVPVERRAWHAGVSVLDGVPRVNDYSVGIEMVNRNDGKDPYPPAQVAAVAGIIRLLRSRYTIPDSRIVSHAAIALPPGRKTDPAGFDFAAVLALARNPASTRAALGSSEAPHGSDGRADEP